MKTVEIKLYEFNELPEDIQEKVIEKNYDININYDWWEGIYDDAENIGLEITSFDIDRGSYCNMEPSINTLEIAQNILNSHGENCDTHKTAENFLEEHSPIYSEYLDEESEHYESTEYEEKLLKIESDFLKSISEDYRIILQKEYEYLTSYETIKETLIINEYNFTINGEIYQ